MSFVSKYGEYALVTGGTSGIGKEIANQLAAKGLNIVLVARNQDELNNTKNEIISKYKIEVNSIQADLSNSDGINKVIDESAKYKVGLFVPAAGMEVNGAFEKNNIESEIKVVQINVISTLQLTHHFVQKMLPFKKGGILFVASLSGHMPNPYFSNYAGSKAYILNFGASLFGELKPKGIDITVLSPGLTRTPMVKDNGIDWAKTPMSFMDASEVAQAGINAIGNKFLAIPGGKNKFMASMAKHSPLEMQAKMNQKMMLKAMSKDKV